MRSPSTWTRRGALLLGMLGLTGHGPLASQAPLTRAVSDSVLLAHLARSDEVRDAYWSDVAPLCRSQQGQAKTACEALAMVRAGTPATVPSRQVDSAARIPRSELGIRQRTGAIHPLIYLYLGFPDYLAADEMRQGRKALTSLVTEYPTWGPGWYALASAVLDAENRPDSALALLAHATASGDVPTLLTRFLTVRAQLRLGRPDARDSLAALLTGPESDRLRNWVRRQLCGAALWCPMRALTRTTPSLADDWQDTTSILVQDLTLPVIGLMADRLTQPPWAYPILVRSRSYAVLEADGGHLHVALSVFRQNLAYQHVATPQGQRFVYPLRVRTVAIREDGLRIVQDTIRRLATATPVKRPRDEERGQLELHTELTLPPGHYVVGVFTSDERGGGSSQIHSVTVSSPSEKSVITAFSAGIAGRGLKASTRAGDVWLAPGGEWLGTDSVALFAQFAGLRPGASYRVNLSFLAIPEVDKWSPAGRRLELFPDPDRGSRVSEVLQADSVVQSWRRVVSLRGLARGPWCMRIELREGDAVVAQRTEPLLLALDYHSWPDFFVVNYLPTVPQACAGTYLSRLTGEETSWGHLPPRDRRNR